MRKKLFVAAFVAGVSHVQSNQLLSSPLKIVIERTHVADLPQNCLRNEANIVGTKMFTFK